MRKLALLSSVLIMMLAVSCGGLGESGARGVADKFIKVFFIEVNFDDARQYVSPELLEEFPDSENMSELENHFVNILKEHAKMYGYKFEYDPAFSQVEEDRAIISYKLTSKANPEWAGVGDVQLRKNEEGKWKVVDYGFDRDEDAIDFGY